MHLRSPYTDPTELRGIIHRRLQTAVRRISWVYLFLVLAFWEFLQLAGDWSWMGTVALFGPVWAVVTPAAIMIPAALFLHRRSLLVLSVALAIGVFQIMGLCVPWRAWVHHSTGGQHLRLLTCNGNYSSLNEAALAGLVDESLPDVVVLQEWNTHHKLPPFVDRNWTCREDGELFIASRYPITQSEDFSDPHWDGWGGAVVRYDIAAPAGTLHLFNIHLASPHLQFQAVIDGKPTGEHLLEVHLEVRREQSQLVSRLADRFGGGAVIAGDFNSIAEGTIFRRSWKHYSDAFNCAGFGLGHTYFAEGAAVRIDHVLAGSDWQFTSCRVGPSVGSPHRPVIADLERIGPKM